MEALKWLKKNQKVKNSRRKERKSAKRIGGKVRPASGALWGAKGDLKLDKFLVESKSTSKGSISVSKLMLNKIEEEALMENRIPVLVLSYDIDDSAYWVLNEGDFLRLIRK